jgi:hypothetical protein
MLYGRIFWNAVEQLLHFRLRDDAPRRVVRVVRVAEIDESDVAVWSFAISSVMPPSG